MLGAGCGVGSIDEATSAPAVTSPLVASNPTTTGHSGMGAGGHPGFRVDLAGTGHQVRGLERQPDGTFKSVCFDDPAALRPAAARTDRQPGAPR
jgi:hypothetical protein